MIINNITSKHIKFVQKSYFFPLLFSSLLKVGVRAQGIGGGCKVPTANQSSPFLVSLLYGTLTFKNRIRKIVESGWFYEII